MEALFADNPDVFVAGDLLWYPVEGDPATRVAPDAMVAFGRPKGDRGSYKQWEENNIAPQVVFEVLSPGNTRRKMDQKRDFYERFGVEEYYLYDPDHGHLQGWQRVEKRLQEIPVMQDWTSPRLGIRFQLDGLDLALFRPDGERFSGHLELRRRAEVAEQRADAEAQSRLEAEAELARLRTLLNNQKS